MKVGYGSGGGRRKEEGKLVLARRKRRKRNGMCLGAQNLGVAVNLGYPYQSLP